VDPRQGSGSQEGWVLDRDLQVVVNGLWAAGAEGITINGQRLTALSAIRSAGEAILVDYRPLSPPYVIQAVGDPEDLQSGFASDLAGSYLKALRDNYNVGATIVSKPRMTLPGNGALILHEAHPPAGPGARRTGAASTTPSGAPSGGATR
jgi:uncharacterized protein YlxW (UPF0749 family)